MNVCYLIHFNDAYWHAKHYVGATDDLEARLARHQRGDGSPLILAALRAGITLSVAVVFVPGWTTETYLKKHNNVARFCPLCQGRGVPRGATTIDLSLFPFSLELNKDGLPDRQQPHEP